MTFTDNVVKDAFLTLEHFLQKVAALDIFEALIFNYKLKVGLLDPLSVNFLNIVTEFSNQLQVLCKEISCVKNEPSLESSLHNVTCDGDSPKTPEGSQEIPLVLSFCNGEVSNKPPDGVEIPVNSEHHIPNTNSENEKKIDGDIIFDCNLEEALKSPILFDEKSVCKEENVDDIDEAKQACSFITTQNDDVTDDGEDMKPILGNRPRGNESTACSFCNKKFPSASRLEGHLSKCSKARAKHRSRGGNYECSICGVEFSCLQSLNVHVSELHPSQPTENLPLFKIVEVESLPENLPFLCCKTCVSVYKTAADFKAHSCKKSRDRVESEGSVGDYVQWLGKYLISNPDLLASMKKFRCGTCREEYRSLNRMLYHLRRCSQGPYPCEVCATEFTTKRELNWHKKKTHRDAYSFFCDECDAVFKLRTSLQKHKVNHHEVQLKTTCEQCNITFAKRVQLTNHMIKEHRAERKFLCQVCGNKFFNHGSLVAHILTHSESWKFDCTFCSKKFRQKEKLKFHMRIHTGERPHLCPTCGKGFIRKTKLDEHIRRHKGEKLHRCGLCGKSYASNWDLRLHSKKLHGSEESTTRGPDTDVVHPYQQEQQQEQVEMEEGEPPEEDPDDPEEAVTVSSPPPAPSAPVPEENTMTLMPAEEPTGMLLSGMSEETALPQLTELPMAQQTTVTAAAMTAAPEGKLVLHLEPAQLPGALLPAATADPNGSRLLLHLGQGGDPSSRILVQLDPSQAAAAGAQTLVPQSHILTVTDGLHLAPLPEEMNLGLSTMATPFIHVHGATGPMAGHGPSDPSALPMHIQLPMSAVQMPTISQPQSGPHHYSLQPVPVQALFTAAGFNVNSISY